MKRFSDPHAEPPFSRVSEKYFKNTKNSSVVFYFNLNLKLSYVGLLLDIYSKEKDVSMRFLSIEMATLECD